MQSRCNVPRRRGQDWEAESLRCPCALRGRARGAGGGAAGAAAGRAHPRSRLRRRRAHRAAGRAGLHGGRGGCRPGHGAQRPRAGRRCAGRGRPRLDFEGEFDAVFSNAALHWMKRRSRRGDRRRGAGAAARRAVRRRDGRPRQCRRDHRGNAGGTRPPRARRCRGHPMVLPDDRRVSRPAGAARVRGRQIELLPRPTPPADRHGAVAGDVCRAGAGAAVPAAERARSRPRRSSCCGLYCVMRRARGRPTMCGLRFAAVLQPKLEKID